MKSGTASFPAPVGGLNARDPLAQMKPTDAAILENFFPETTYVAVRRGFTRWATGIPGAVESLFTYSPKIGGNRLFAVASGNIYEATSAGPVGAAAVTGLSSSRWEYTNITTPGGSFLWAVNGLDAARIFDGATWAPVSITGVSSNNLISLCVFGARLWMVEKNSLKVWYLGVQAISGAATAFDLSTVFPRGGSLVAMGTWSIDAGSGLSDQAVFVSSEGEVAVYSGTDPASWQKIGLYYVGRPIGRPLLKAAGDILLLTEQGIYPLSEALQSATIDRSVAITDKIQNAITEDIQIYGQNFGWHMRLFPSRNQLWLNVPKGTRCQQYVMNTITRAWAKFTGINALVFETSGKELFFGTANGLFRAWTGDLDDGASIRADALPAYSNFKSPANGKYFTMVRPSIISNGNPSILFGLNLDFINTPASGVLAYTPVSSSMVWGSMVWGSMVWTGGYRQFSQWQTVGGVGYYAAIRLTVQSNGSNVQWNATDFVYERGGVLS